MIAVDAHSQVFGSELGQNSGSIRVFCRVRPLISTSNLKTKSTVTVKQEKIAVQSLGIKKEFIVDRVFDQESKQGNISLTQLSVFPFDIWFI
jgi:hypothetical protein